VTLRMDDLIRHHSGDSLLAHRFNEISLCPGWDPRTIERAFDNCFRVDLVNVLQSSSDARIIF